MYPGVDDANGNGLVVMGDVSDVVVYNIGANWPSAHGRKMFLSPREGHLAPGESLALLLLIIDSGCEDCGGCSARLRGMHPPIMEHRDSNFLISANSDKPQYCNGCFCNVSPSLDSLLVGGMFLVVMS